MAATPTDKAHLWPEPVHGEAFAWSRCGSPVLTAIVRTNFAQSDRAAAGLQPLDEPALIRAAQVGQGEAFAQLVLAHQVRIYALAHGILEETAHAADGTQESFLAAYRHL